MKTSELTQYRRKPLKVSRSEIAMDFLNMAIQIFGENSFWCRSKSKIKSYLIEWVETGEFGPDHDDADLIRCEYEFKEYLNLNYDIDS